MATEYAISLGSNVALASLNNAENYFGSRNRVTANNPLLPISIKATMIDPFPVRVGDQAGGESGDGFLIQDWTMTLAVLGYKFLVDTYFASETITQAAVTVYTRRHMLGSYLRYNATAILPSAANGDFTLLKDDAFQGSMRIRLRFRDLTVAV